MKRMKKKVVAMVTLAMFVMTLLPMAAFAAPTEDYTLEVSSTSTEVKATQKVGLEVKIPAEKVKYEMWAEKDGERVDSVDFYLNDVKQTARDGIVTYTTSTAGVKQFGLVFNQAGDYTINGLKYVYQGGDEYTTEEMTASDVITVDPVAVVTVDQVGTTRVELDDKNGKVRHEVKIKATAKDGNASRLEDTVVTIDNPFENRGLAVVDKDGDAISEVELDSKGEATFYVTAEKRTPGNVSYELDLLCNDVEGTASVYVEGEDEASKTAAATIEALPVDGVISANDLGKVEFEVRNADGDKINATEEPFTENTTANTSKYPHNDYVKVISPEKGLKADNVFLTYDADTENMELKITNASSLKAGEYTIEFTLKNGEKATTTFELDKFGDVAKIQIVPDKTTGAVVVAGDSNYAAAAKYTVEKVDENGLTEELNASEYAVAYEVPENSDVIVKSTTKGQLQVKSATGDKKDILGAKVTLLVTYMDGKTPVVATQEFTVVDKTELLSDYELVLDYKEDGKVLKNNEVTAKIVNKNNDKDTLEIQNLYVSLASQSNKDAKVSIKKNGNNKFDVYATKDTSVELKVYAFANDADYGNGSVVLSKNITMNLGDEVIPAGTSVVMTLGSTEMIVNNNVVDMKDAAPFAQDNRTYVPFRALGEALGAKVDFDKDAKTVTYTLGGTKIVMTLDSKTYTVNGTEKTMDVAPFAKDNRTYVPVRFVGEGLGFTVTGLTNANGQYVAVAFTK